MQRQDIVMLDKKSAINAGQTKNCILLKTVWKLFLKGLASIYYPRAI